MQNGTKPQRLKWKDRDYLKSFHPQLYAGTTTAPQFPAEFLTDKTNWLPDQDADGQPNGCTNYASTKLARILGIDASIATPQKLEAVTHANANGGFGVLASIDAARTVLGWFKWRYIIQTTGSLDFFSTCQLAQVSGLPEQRGISMGSPWFKSWEDAVRAGIKILPMPSMEELAQAHSSPNSLPWHDYGGDGWSQNFTVAPGRLMYRIDSWQGNLDYLYMPREVMNVVFDLYGTVQVIPTNMDVLPARIPLPDWFWSLWHSWLGFSY